MGMVESKAQGILEEGDLVTFLLYTSQEVFGEHYVMKVLFKFQKKFTLITLEAFSG